MFEFKSFNGRVLLRVPQKIRSLPEMNVLTSWPMTIAVTLIIINRFFGPMSKCVDFFWSLFDSMRTNYYYTTTTTIIITTVQCIHSIIIANRLSDDGRIILYCSTKNFYKIYRYPGKSGKFSANFDRKKDNLFYVN